jgi:hypothetical protein
MTSLSLSQTENLSQTSDNLYIPNDTKQNSVSGNKTEGKNEEKIIDYFFCYENYFRIIFPEKFNEYKTSRNYLPKKFKDIDKNVSNENNNNININNVTQNEYNNNQEENKVINSNNFQFGNNYYYYPMNGNIMYYLYNNFYINFANIHPPSQDETTDEKIEKEVHTVKKEEEIHKKIQDETEPKKDEKTESKDNSNEEGEYEHIYIIKRKNVRNNNNKKYNKQERQERPKEKNIIKIIIIIIIMIVISNLTDMLSRENNINMKMIFIIKNTIKKYTIKLIYSFLYVNCLYLCNSNML